MAPFLDSADLDNIAYGEVMVIIRGIAMNPTLPRSHTNDPLKHLCAVLDVSGEVMHQPTKVDQNALDEALHELDRERVVPHPLLRRPRGTRPAPQQSTPRGRDGPRAAQPGDDCGRPRSSPAAQGSRGAIRGC
jgi:hypothetical protein